MMQSRIVQDAKTLDKVRAFLSSCYVDYLHWDIVNDNPSGIRISHSNDNDAVLITDDYDLLSDWFFVTEHDQEIACARLCTTDSNGLLEIERYANAAKKLHHLFKQKHTLRIVELNREAILPQYAHTKKPYFLLLQNILTHCIDKNYSILTTTNLPEWVAIYDYIGFKKLDDAQFKYFNSDRQPVNVYFISPDHIKKIAEKISKALMRLQN